MSDPVPSAFVERCITTLAEYSRLRFLGVSHEMARRQSGFEDAAMGKPAKSEPVRDVRKIVSGDEG